MRKTLIGLTIGQVVALVAVLVGYLLAIAATLRQVAQALAKITMGVRAIERQTEPIGPTLRDVNGDLQAVLNALEGSREGSASES
ncbi:MAG: hypothetical protein KY433_08255 [Actinobacteria bacterium]|nr:hypothetical protein [Actinomycetota bacterium]